MRIRYAGIDLGPGFPIEIQDFDPSFPEMRTNDNPREARDGVIPGNDFFGARTVTVEAFTNGSTMQEARESVSALLRVWRGDRVRLSAGRSAPLDFRPDGATVWRRLYGRPRNVDDPNFGIAMVQGQSDFTLEFEVMDPLVYIGGEDEAQREELRIVEAPGGGSNWVPDPVWNWPVTPGEGELEQRAGSIDVGGFLPTALSVEFHGPGRRFLIRGVNGLHVGLRPSVELAYDESIFIDPLEGTVLDNWGNSRYGVLDDETLLTDLTINPGLENLFFSADDSTHTARAAIEWRPADSSLA